ncbi:MAG TPA: hypothetical protein V6D11_12140 [Waterburya sp.]
MEKRPLCQRQPKLRIVHFDRAAFDEAIHQGGAIGDADSQRSSQLVQSLSTQ